FLAQQRGQSQHSQPSPGASEQVTPAGQWSLVAHGEKSPQGRLQSCFSSIDIQKLVTRQQHLNITLPARQLVARGIAALVLTREEQRRQLYFLRRRLPGKEGLVQAFHSFRLIAGGLLDPAGQPLRAG